MLTDELRFKIIRRLGGITRFYIQGGYDPERTPALIDALSA